MMNDKYKTNSTTTLNAQ